MAQFHNKMVGRTAKLESIKERAVAIKGAKYGALSGFIATWAISSGIALAEFVLGLQLGTFYSIMGISLGVENIVAAAYLGFGLHLLVGTALGTILGVIGIRWKKIRMLNPFRSSIIGIGAGLAIWLMLFLPVTTLLIQPSMQRIVVILSVASNEQLSSSQVNSIVTNITLMAIVFHAVWGTIFGFMMSSLLRIRKFKIQLHYMDIINIDPNIRLVTICDANGKIMYSRHRQGIKNLLNEDESKKSLELAMSSWKTRNELSQKIGRGRYVLAEYEKIKRITLPFGDDLLLYITTEIDADHRIIIDKIRSLELGLKYTD